MLPRKGIERRLQVTLGEVRYVEQKVTAELAPAEFAKEFFDVAGKLWVFGRGETRRVPDLSRADLAEPKVRRQPRRAVAVGPVALARIAGDGDFEELLGVFLCRRLPGDQVSRSPPAQSGFEGSSCHCRIALPSRSRYPFSARGAGGGFGGSPLVRTRLQNGVNTRRPRPSLLRIAVGVTK